MFITMELSEYCHSTTLLYANNNMQLIVGTEHVTGTTVHHSHSRYTTVRSVEQFQMIKFKFIQLYKRALFISITLGVIGVTKH